MTLESFVKKTGQTLQEHSPSILAALGVAGVVATGYLANRAGLQASPRLYEVEEAKGEPLTGKEKVDVTWKLYIPVFFAAGTSIACIIASTTVSNRRNTALMSAVTLGETAFREYREKMIEVAGKQKDQKAVDAIAQDKVDSAEKSEVVFVGDDKILCFDTLTGRFFESTRSLIEKAEININRQILGDMYASQNDWYDAVGLKRIDGGDEVGWNNETPLDIMYSAVLEDDKPVLAVSYRFLPKLGFSKIW